jgi:translocation and assembly module TamB
VTEPAPKPRRWWKYLLPFTAAFLIALAGIMLYLRTDSFQALVRSRLVAELERVSGGRVEIGSIHTTPFRLQADVRAITIHGREAANEVPLAHVDRIVARLKPGFLLRSEFGFDEVVLEHPVVHVEFYPDGTTNFPPRTASVDLGKSPVERLFALSISHFELRHGQVLWDDQTIPVDLAARDASLSMNYSFLHQRYDGRLLLGLVDTKFENCRPFAWMTSLEFTLSSNSAVLTSFKWNSGHSHVTGNGQVTDFRHPQLQASYEAQFDLGEAASTARRNELRAGVADFRGHGVWSLTQPMNGGREFSINGVATLRDLAWQDADVAFSNASFATDYSLTDQNLTLSKVQGRIFGGVFSGDASFNQWLSPAQHLTAGARKALETAVISADQSNKKPSRKTSKIAAAAPKPPAVQNASIVFHLRDVSVEDLALAFNRPTHPVLAPRPAGLASGTLETRWMGTPRDADVLFALDFAPPAHSGPGQVSLNGHASGAYHLADDSLDLPQFALNTPTSRIQASGTLSATSAMHVSAMTSSLVDWLALAAFIRGPAVFPVKLNGSATFNGTMGGSFSSPQLAGSLSADNFYLTLPATSKTRELETHWDSLAASVQVSFSGVSLRSATLRRADASADFDASATLQHGHIVPDSAFTLRLNGHNIDLGELEAFTGHHYPISGKADWQAKAGGTIANPHADGQIHLSDATAYGETIQRFDSTYSLANNEIRLENAHLIYDGSIASGRAAYNFSTRVFNLDLTGNNFDLSRIQQLESGRTAIAGRSDFHLQASGARDAPSITADIHVRGLTLDEELLGDLNLQAVTRGSELQLTGQSNFQHGSLAVDGGVQLRDGYPANISLQMDHLDIDAILRSYLHDQLTGHSSTTATVALRGPLFAPRQWAVDGNLSALSLEIKNVEIHNQDPVRFSLANRQLTVLQLHLLGQGTDLTAQGSVELKGARNVNFTAKGQLDLRLLESFDPNFTSSGLVTVDMTVGGTTAQPLPQGRFRFSDGSLAYAGLPSGLTDLNGSIQFTRDHVHIETLAARTGGGTLDLKGDATYFNRQLNFDLTATGKSVRLRYPPGVSSTADTELHWVGSRSASTVSGDISVTKIAVTPGFDFSTYLERSRQFTTTTTANSPLYNVKLDIHVQTAPELQMRTAIARLSGDADLHIRGTVARPAVLGRADVLEGRATFHGTRFELERGDITFANPVAIEPQLNLQAATHVRNYDLNITVTGTPDRLAINYRSEPPLPKSDIIALLALGRTGEESQQIQEQTGQTAFPDQATAEILSQALNTTVQSRMEKLFGASNIKIDPQGLTTETNPTGRGPQVTIEQEFANNVSITYSTNVSQSAEQIIQGEYYFNRNVSILGTRDQNGVVSFDLQLRRRKK